MRPVPLLRKGQMRKHRANQPKLYQSIKAQFIEHDSFGDICKGHRRVENVESARLIST